MSELIKIAPNGQWSIVEKAVHPPSLGSASVESRPNEEGSAKPTKIRVGNPEHNDPFHPNTRVPKGIGPSGIVPADHVPTRNGAQREYPFHGNKTATSGQSTLRSKMAPKHHEDDRETEPPKRG